MYDKIAKTSKCLPITVFYMAALMTRVPRRFGGLAPLLGALVVTFSLPGAAAVVSRKTSASRRRSKAA